MAVPSNAPEPVDWILKHICQGLTPTRFLNRSVTPLPPAQPEIISGICEFCWPTEGLVQLWCAVFVCRGDSPASLGMRGRVARDHTSKDKQTTHKL